uniref:Reverse transcriptase domain-containing protein n=1 Tax=Xenopus tropicalis TaxID=8364 RepID=A0A803K472_XENTR
MPGRSTDTNIRRLYTNLSIKHDNVGNRVIVSLDNEKAFDSVEWDYLWATLQSMGIPPTFITWIQALYTSPTAKIHTNNTLSNLFPISRGTRQGCPLSPLLFALAMEPLACRLKLSQEVEGLKLGNTTELVSMYADDTLLYLANPHQALTSALDIINNHTIFSGLKINWSKSVILPIDTPPNPPNQTNQLNWVTSFKYLGVWIHGDLKKYIDLNINPTMRTLENKTETWRRLPLTLTGRINLFKMIAIPKLTYIYRQSPIIIPQSIFRKLESLMVSLFWNGEQPRMSLHTLQLPTTSGGLAAPNPYKYYLASQLVTAWRWTSPSLTNAATLLEIQIIGSQEELQNLLYRGTINSKRATQPMRTTVSVWKKALKIFPKPQPHCSQYTPLWHNPNLEQLQTIPDPKIWLCHNIKYLSDIMPQGTLLTFQELKQTFSLPNTMLFRYLQLRHAIGTQFGGQAIDTTPRNIENLTHTENLNKPLSVFYTQLMGVCNTNLIKLREKWQQDIPQLTPDIWEDILESTLEGIISSRDRLTQLKYLHRTYLTPQRLHKMHPNIGQECPRCHHSPADFIHMVWSCPRAQRFWGKVAKTIRDRTNLILQLDPITILLNQVEDLSPNRAERTLLLILCMYAKKTVALYWKSPEGPRVAAWESMINKAIPLYKLTYIRRGCPQKFDKIWAAWLDAEPS